ncbi:MAG: ATP-dependent Clp protease ATP-binding subunit ClpX [Planctomycetota bacterium]
MLRKTTNNNNRGLNQGPPERCSFCGQTKRPAEMIAGLGRVSICIACVELCNQMLVRDKVKPHRKTFPKEALLKKIPIPLEIKAHLDKYVIGQDYAKKILAVAVNNHYKRILNPVPAHEVELEKSNVLLIGPTGCGKTLLARTLAKFLDVPLAIGDATTLTEAGYVGEDVENLLLRLIQAADYDLERAERGIIYIDEIDKIGRTHDNPSITRDVSGEGVQQGLLKMLEGTISNVPPQGGRKHPEQEYIKINTEHILFMAGGTFDGIEHIIGRRIGQKQIGFDSKQVSIDELQLGDILEHVEPEDLMEFGMIPEFIGRFPITCVVRPLTLAELTKVMTAPKNAIIRQYQEFFRMENAALEFTPPALEAIAKKALAKKTGARAIRAIIEELMLDIMFELPSIKGQKTYIISDKMVEGKEPIKLAALKEITPAKETA